MDATMRDQLKQQVEQTGSVQGMEYQVRRRDGSIIWIREKLIKIGAKVVRHSKKVIFQMAEVAPLTAMTIFEVVSSKAF